MPSDRIKFIAFKRGTGAGSMRFFRADALQYQFIEDKFQAELLDGTEVEKFNFMKIEFQFNLYYFEQEVLAADGVLPASVVNAFASDMATTRINLYEILNWFTNLATAVKFYPRIVDNAEVEYTDNYDVRNVTPRHGLIKAVKNGRFKPDTTITLRTINPVSTYPNWLKS